MLHTNWSTVKAIIDFRLEEAARQAELRRLQPQRRSIGEDRNPRKILACRRAWALGWWHLARRCSHPTRPGPPP
jgi:hypothetical protein